VIVPVGVELEPVTDTVTVRLSAVAMLLDAGVTVTVGVRFPVAVPQYVSRFAASTLPRPEARS